MQLRSGRATNTSIAQKWHCTCKFDNTDAAAQKKKKHMNFGNSFAAESHFESACNKSSKASGLHAKQAPRNHASVVLPGRAQ